MTRPLDYKASGVDYDVMDPFKRACQLTAATTTPALARHGLSEVPGTRGESSYLLETPTEYLAHVEEALGTKTLVADAMYALTGRSFYHAVAIDDVSTIVNDLCVCGALPVTVAMYAAVGDGAYFADETRARDLAQGFAEGCRRAGAAWSGGETQTLKGMITPGTVILGGSALGRICPKDRRITGLLTGGEDIVFLASSGVHTNGLTLCRALADRLPLGYLTPLPDGRTYGEALLEPSIIYSGFIAACHDAHFPLTYAVHMTGHGWRNRLRPREPFVYRITNLGGPQLGGGSLFDVIGKTAGLDQREMFGTFNMGVGFAVYVPPGQGPAAVKLAQATGYQAWLAGKVTKDGPRKAVELAPLNLVYPGDELQIR